MKLKHNLIFILKSIVLCMVMNLYIIIYITSLTKWLWVPALGVFLWLNIKPSLQSWYSGRTRVLANGIELLKLFLATLIASVPVTIAFMIHTIPEHWWNSVFHILIVIGLESIVFWNGIIRVYATSIQLGIRWRVLGIVCGWIPIAHLIVLCKIISITTDEIWFEQEKYEIDQIRQIEGQCSTKYPLLMVHGVFFRDTRFFDYWGRIPKELIKNGATIYYGEQQSAASVQECGIEIAEKIKQIVAETGCEKVNIIAHSKGGLDARYAISCAGAAPYVASLTTINTPHRGCIFADYLLDKIPVSVQNKVAKVYNTTLRKFGDHNPDFLLAVKDLRASACHKMNEEMLDQPDVYYQSVGSKLNHAVNGQFPLNLSYPLVHHFDQDNDGLVSVDSAKWGSKFTFLTVNGNRGISHGDVIDLNRENITGYDVREFYVWLVRDLKEMGL